jgi:hypothetical protein
MGFGGRRLSWRIRRGHAASFSAVCTVAHHGPGFALGRHATDQPGDIQHIGQVGQFQDGDPIAVDEYGGSDCSAPGGQAKGQGSRWQPTACIVRAEPVECLGCEHAGGGGGW